jgi:hypothetical protein
MVRNTLQKAAVSTALLVLVGGTGVANAQTTPEKAFLETGDAICKKSNERLAEKALKFERFTLIKRETAKSVTQRVAKPADVAEFVTKVAIEEIQAQLNGLGELKPSKTLAPGFSAAMKEANSALAKMKAKPTEAAFANPFAKSSKMFSALGFKSCGQAEAGSKGV